MIDFGTEALHISATPATKPITKPFRYWLVGYVAPPGAQELAACYRLHTPKNVDMALQVLGCDFFVQSMRRSNARVRISVNDNPGLA